MGKLSHWQIISKTLHSIMTFISTFLKKNRPPLLSLLGGMLYSSGFPLFIGGSFFLGPIIGFFLFNYALFLEEKNFRKQLLIAFMFSLGFYLLGFYWIPHTLKEFGGLFFPINQLLGLLFSLVIIPQVYVYTIIQRKWKNPVLLSICYVILEEFIPQQFPAHIGHSFASLAPNFPLKLAPLFGAPVYSFLTALIALSILEHVRTKKTPALHYALFFLMIILNFTLKA